MATTGTRNGTFGNWGTDQELSLANEESNDREWLGDLHLVPRGAEEFLSPGSQILIKLQPHQAASVNKST